MDKMQEKTKKVLKELEKTRTKKWTPEIVLAYLMEEVGELSNAILVKEGLKHQNRKKANLTDSLCDVLFNLFILAEYYGIDVEKEYQKVLEQLRKRMEKGEI